MTIIIIHMNSIVTIWITITINDMINWQRTIWAGWLAGGQTTESSRDLGKQAFELSHEWVAPEDLRVAL